MDSCCELMWLSHMFIIPHFGSSRQCIIACVSLLVSRHIVHFDTNNPGAVLGCFFDAVGVGCVDYDSPSILVEWAIAHSRVAPRQELTHIFDISRP